MFELLIVVALLGASFTVGTVDGQNSAKVQIGEACIKKGSFEVKGHTFKCERTKIKEGL